MPRCASCGSGLVRSHRSGFEKLFYRAVYRCANCSAKQKEPLQTVSPLTRYAHCPRCGNPSPVVRSRPDKIDRMIHGPLRLLHRLLGGTLYHCIYCRLQFYDLRKKKPAAESVAPLAR